MDGTWQYFGKVGKPCRPVRARVSNIHPFLWTEVRLPVAAPDFGPIHRRDRTHRRAGNDHAAGLRFSGPGRAIAFLISTLGVLLVALNVNQFARISSSPGSLYSYITDHMHPRWGVLAGWALLIAYIGTAAAVSAGVTNYANVMLRDRFGVQAFPLLLTALVTAIACYLGLSRRANLHAPDAVAASRSVALISLIAIARDRQAWMAPRYASSSRLQGVTPEKLRLGLVLAIFSSVGFESATSLGSEARDPLINIPRAVKWSAILAGLFFFLCAYAEVLAFRGETQSLGQNPAPLHVLARQIGLPPIMGTLTDLGAVVTFFSCFLACITASARVLFLMGRHGALHSVLGEAHEENQTPHRAVLLSSIAAFLPAGIMTLRGMNLFDIYGLIGTLATFGFVTAYILVSAAAPIFLRSRGLLDATGHRHFRSGDSGDVRPRCWATSIRFPMRRTRTCPIFMPCCCSPVSHGLPFGAPVAFVRARDPPIRRSSQ